MHFSTIFRTKWTVYLGILCAPLFLGGCAFAGFGGGGGVSMHTSLRAQQRPHLADRQDTAERARIQMTCTPDGAARQKPDEMPSWLEIGGDIEMTYIAHNFGAIGR